MKIGYIYDTDELTKEDEMFLDAVNQMKHKVVLYSVTKSLDRLPKCDVAINNSAETTAHELAKTLEYYGTKVVNPSNSYYYSEDKWLFYLKCKELGLNVPETKLLPVTINGCRDVVEDMGKVVIKNVMSDNGDLVEKADDIEEASKIIKIFRERDNAPLIAQQFLKNSNKVYRVTIIGNEIVQAVIRKSTYWKCTSARQKKDYKRFDVPKQLAKQCLQLSKKLKLPWCGIDLLEDNGKFYFLEINSAPGMDFIDSDVKMLYEKLIDFADDRQRKKA